MNERTCNAEEAIVEWRGEMQQYVPCHHSYVWQPKNETSHKDNMNNPSIKTDLQR